MSLRTATYSQHFRDYQIAEWSNFYVQYEQHKHYITRLYLKLKNEKTKRDSIVMEQLPENIELLQQRIRQEIIKVDDFFMIQLDLCYMMKNNYEKHTSENHLNINNNTNLSTLMELISKLFNLYEFVWHNYTALTKLVDGIEPILKHINHKKTEDDEEKTAADITEFSLIPPDTPQPQTPDRASTKSININILNDNQYSNLQNELKNMKMIKNHPNVKDTLDICLTLFYSNHNITQNHYDKIQSIIKQYNTNLAETMSCNVLPKSFLIQRWFYQYNNKDLRRYSLSNTKTQKSTKTTSKSTKTTSTAANTISYISAPKFTSIPSDRDIDEELQFDNIDTMVDIQYHNYKYTQERPITAHTDRSHENLSDLWPDFSETRIDYNDTTRTENANSSRVDVKNLKIRTSMITPNQLTPASINSSKEIEIKTPTIISPPIPDINQCCVNSNKSLMEYIMFCVIMML